jgi:glycosyltransferase involved in cell wall biosynthesis
MTQRANDAAPVTGKAGHRHTTGSVTDNPASSAASFHLRVVMLVASFLPLPEGGSEKQCRLLAAELARRGHEITVVTCWPGKSALRKERLDGVLVRRLGCGHPLSSLARKMGARIRARRDKQDASAPAANPTTSSSARQRPMLTAPLLWLEYLAFLTALAVWLVRHRRHVDLLHAHESHWLAGFAAWMGQCRQVPVLIKEATFPVLAPTVAPVPGRATWDRCRLRAAYIAQTEAAARQLEAVGVYANKIHILPNGVHIPSEHARPETSREVLFVGNLYQGAELKAFDVLFGAWCQVAVASPGARLLVVGAGDPSTWQEFLRARGAEKSVTFCGPSQELDCWYARAAMLVLPSRHEGMPNAVLEAQAWGLPVVVSDIPGCCAAVLPGETGFVVPVGNEDMLAAAMVRLLEHPAQRARMGRAARDWAERQFAFSGIAGAVELCYRGVMTEFQDAARRTA